MSQNSELHFHCFVVHKCMPVYELNFTLLTCVKKSELNDLSYCVREFKISITRKYKKNQVITTCLVVSCFLKQCLCVKLFLHSLLL